VLGLTGKKGGNIFPQKIGRVTNLIMKIIKVTNRISNNNIGPVWHL
jgi:hypothetical protein